MYFVGVDLAWSPRRSSAAVSAAGDGRGAEVTGWQEHLMGVRDIVQFIEDEVGDSPALVAIDAPLVVPNSSGMRDCDVAAYSLLRSFKAGVLPVNRSNLGRYNGFQGEALAVALLELGYSHRLGFHPRPSGHSFFEMYPHASAVALFHLPERLLYKSRGSRRPWSTRLEAYRDLQRSLASLESSNPALSTPSELLHRDVAALKGDGLKAYEDLLDAILCAYTAYHSWYWEDSRSVVLGSLEGGYLVLPLDGRLREKLGSLGLMGTETRGPRHPQAYHRKR